MEEEAKQDEPIKVEEPRQQPKAKKHHRLWPWIVGIIVIILLIPVLVLGYLGFMPGVSSLFGANNPKDLGVHWTAADYASYQQKTGAQFLNFANAPDNPAKPGKKIVFADPKQMDLALTQSEVTATINSVGWVWMPLKDVQVKFDNGAVEVSGKLNTANIANFVKFIGGVGYDQSQVDKALSWVKRFAGDPAIYIKANASVVNNNLSLQIVQAKVGRLSVPLDVAGKVLNAGTGSIEHNAIGYNVQNATFSNGQLHFTGISPTTIYVKKS